MTCTLRYVDVRYLLPKRLAFAEAVDTGEAAVAGHIVANKDSTDGVVFVDVEGQDDARKTADVTVKGGLNKDASL